MTDIVERLRDLAMYVGVQNEKDGALIREGANEILRLREAVENAKALAGVVSTGPSFADIRRDAKTVRAD